jgi:hypothetical protein
MGHEEGTATSITDDLTYGGTLEYSQAGAAHESPPTTTKQLSTAWVDTMRPSEAREIEPRERPTDGRIVASLAWARQAVRYCVVPLAL